MISHTESWLKDQVYEFLAEIKFVCHADTAFAMSVILDQGWSEWSIKYFGQVSL